jgi:hypothetical protein
LIVGCAKAAWLRMRVAIGVLAGWIGSRFRS